MEIVGVQYNLDHLVASTRMLVVSVILLLVSASEMAEVTRL